MAAVMESPTRDRIVKVSWRVNALQLIFYGLIGIAGYLSFLQQTSQDLLLDYPTSDVAINVGRILLTFTMLIALPLNLNPTIRSGLQFGNFVRGGNPQTQSEIGRVLLTILCIAWQAVIAVLVPGVADVLSILGATVATATMLAIPAYAMSIVMPRTFKTRLQQGIMIVFSLVSVASVPIKFLRLWGVMSK